MRPTGVRPMILIVDRPQIRPSVVTTAEDGTGILVGTSQISHASQIALATVADDGPVAPSRVGVVATHGIAAVGIVPDGMHGLSRTTVKDRQRSGPVRTRPFGLRSSRVLSIARISPSVAASVTKWPLPSRLPAEVLHIISARPSPSKS